MAINEWIAVRKNLAGDPAVIRMADKLQVRTEVVVGYLHSVWSWLDSNTSNGVVNGCQIEAIEQHLSLPNFLKLMCEVGWLEYENETLMVPKWDAWFSHSAKNRLKKSKNQRERRRSKSEAKVKPSNGVTFSSSSSCSCSSSKKRKGIQLPFQSDAFKASWQGFCESRRKIRSPMTDRAKQMILKKLDGLSEQQAIECLDESTSKGWKGVFPENLKMAEPVKSWWQE